MGISYNPRTVTDGLVLALDAGNTKSYPGSGTTWTDLSDKGNNGTISGATHTSGVGGYFNYDGTNDKVECASNSNFAFGTGDFAIEIWWRSDKSSQTALTGLLSISSPAASSNWQLGPGNQTDNTKIVFSGGAHTSAPVITDPTSYSKAVWTNTVVTRISSTLKMYTDSVNVVSTSDSSNYSDTGVLKIGVNRGLNYYWDGRISVVRLYKGKGLTAAEVKQNFNALRGRYGV